MPSIFDDEHRGSGPISPDPEGTGRFFAPECDRGAASRAPAVGPATVRRPLLTLTKNRSRPELLLVGRKMNVDRP